MKCAEAWQARQTGKNTRNLVTQIDRDKATFVLWTIHILRHHIFGIFGPPSPYVSMFLILRISKNWHFLTPPPPPLQVLT